MCQKISGVKCAVIVDDVVNRSGGRIPEVLTYRGLRRAYVYLRTHGAMYAI